MIHENDDVPLSELLLMLKSLLTFKSRENKEIEDVAIGNILLELKRRGIDWDEQATTKESQGLDVSTCHYLLIRARSLKAFRG